VCRELRNREYFQKEKEKERPDIFRSINYIEIRGALRVNLADSRYVFIDTSLKSLSSRTLATTSAAGPL